MTCSRRTRLRSSKTGRPTPNYWDQGKPYADELENISIDDNNARLNALLAGEVDMMGQLPYQQAKAQQAQGQIQVLVGESPAPQMFLMRVDREPFTDVRVRQAMRLIANRQALIDGALAGFGTVANDLVGAGLPYFAEDIPPREQDIEQAKALLKQAGREDLRVTLHTSEIVTGFVEAATLLAEQAKDAGVTIDIKKEPANAYFDSSLLYTKLDFAQSNWIIASLAQFYTQALLSDAVWNETHWRDEAFDKLVQDAQAATDDETATELWRQAQQVQFDQGGYIVWSNTNNVDGLANNVRGLLPSSFGSLGGWNYQDVWLA
jgi:peptide/nickel transport system substrate-binding protein